MICTCNPGNGESNAYGGVTEGHDGCEDWEPWELVEVGYLAQDDLDAGEDDHERVLRRVARRFMPVLVVAIWLSNGAVSYGTSA